MKIFISIVISAVIWGFCSIGMVHAMVYFFDVFGISLEDRLMFAPLLSVGICIIGLAGGILTAKGILKLWRK